METIVGIGIDQIEIERVLTACQKKKFVERYFSAEEQKLFVKRQKRAAVNFAGKEAVVKCLGTGFGKIHPIEIEILRNELGAPYVTLHGNAKKRAEELRISQIHISLTDTRTMASAYAVAVGNME